MSWLSELEKVYDKASKFKDDRPLPIYHWGEQCFCNDCP